MRLIAPSTRGHDAARVDGRELDHVCRERARRAEVDHHATLDVAVSAFIVIEFEQNVLELEVSMDDEMALHMQQSRSDLHDDSRDCLRR